MKPFPRYIKSIAFLSSFLVFAMQAAFSQVSVTLNNVLPFYFKPADVVNLSVFNTQAAIDVYLKASIVSKSSNLEVRISSSPFTLNQGANNLSANPQARFDYEYNSVAQSFNIDQGSILPFGKYTIRVYLFRANSNEQLSNDQFEQDVSPVSPPFLISPANQSTIDNSYPNLIWSPPLPVDKRYHITYDMKIVEILQNQTPYEAIQKNFAVYEQKELDNAFLQYPANAISLELDKKYAWQVVARINNYFVGETEVFSFNLARPKMADNSTIIYGALSKQLDAGYYTASGKKLYFRYLESYNNDVLSFRILNDKSKDIRDNCSLTVNKKLGENRFMIDLSYCSDIRKGFYVLEVSSEKNEIYKLKFKVE